MFKPNSKAYKILVAICSVIITAALGYLIALAGDLEPSSSPSDTMVSLEDIYYELDKDASATSSWGLDSSAAPTSTMYTLQQLYDKTPKFHSNPGDASTSDVLGSKTFYKDSSTKLTGILATQTLSAATTTVSAGYYNATSLDAVDTDLVVGNIKSGITIFGLAGDYSGYPGTGWQLNPSGDGSTPLTQTACENASSSGWYWFENGNGDGDTADPEDGICVLDTETTSKSWNGDDSASQYDNTYIASYECEGNFPNGTIKAGTYRGVDVASTTPEGCTFDTTWNAGDCALCQADCYDGKKDLPNNPYATSSHYIPKYAVDGHNGPITPEVLKDWKGTKLPTSNDFFGFCGYKDGGSNYETGCSSATTTGDYGQMVGRTDECMDLSNSGSWEWLSEQHSFKYARLAGADACSYFYYCYVYSDYRFRAVFRP